MIEGIEGRDGWERIPDRGRWRRWEYNRTQGLYGRVLLCVRSDEGRVALWSMQPPRYLRPRHLGGSDTLDVCDDYQLPLHLHLLRRRLDEVEDDRHQPVRVIRMRVTP